MLNLEAVFKVWFKKVGNEVRCGSSVLSSMLGFGRRL